MNMSHWFTQLALLAQEAQKAAEPAKKAAEAQPGLGLPNMVVMMVAVGIFYYFLILRPQRRDQAKRKDKIDSMKKNDRVITIGGIIGTVANISEDGREITLKIDDNSKIKMLGSSIQGPYQPDTDNDQNR